MRWSPKIDLAIEVAAKQHVGQLRRNGETPYVFHPFAVAWMVSEYTESEDTIIAALLHDVVEDTVGYGIEEIRADFGPDVAEMVGVLSENMVVLSERKMPWIEKKKRQLKRLEVADYEVLLVKMMDRLHNAVTLAKELRKEGDDFWKKFNGTKTEKYQWEIMSYEMFVERGLPEKLCKEFRELIAKIYGM